MTVDGPDVLVLGAGVAGTATAFGLAKRGLEACVIHASAGATALWNGVVDGLTGDLEAGERELLEALGLAVPRPRPRIVTALGTSREASGHDEALLDLESARPKLVLVPTLPRAGSIPAIALAITAIAAALLYYVSADARGGRTVGKRWLNVRLCRRDGGDLGVGRAVLRTRVVAPGLLMIAPTLATCVQSLVALGSTGSWSPRALVGPGIGWFVVLELLGRMSAFGRPLQDGVAGAVTYAAQRATTAIAPPPSSSERSPARALRLSVFPGLGVMYAGHPLLGVGVLALVLYLLIDAPDPRTGLGVWLLSAFLARGLARRKLPSGSFEAPQGNVATPRLPTPIRRQES